MRNDTEQLILFAEDSLARTSAWRDAVLGWLESGADCSLNSRVSLMQSLPLGFSQRTFLAFCHPEGGADFATVLGELSGFFPEVPADGWRNSGVCSGPKGTVAWRVLDAQYFGVAQRRRRVFIVRSPATCRSGAFQVLFESESVSGDSPPSRKEGERVAGTLTEGFGSRGVDADQTANGNYAIGDEVSLCLKASGDFKQDPTHETYVVAATGVRRLTPTEAERLQGFPDGWTLLGDKTPDSPRYKACGNAVCVNVAEWIGRRLMSVISEEAKL